jgi:hypothetical protein
MKLQPADVTIGKIYAVHHARKGHFVGELINLEDTPAGDTQDVFFLTMKIDVRKGTDQERLANASEAVAVKNIRPSLIVTIAETEQGQWLRQVHIARPPTQIELQEQEQARLADALRQAMTQIRLAEDQAVLQQKKPGFIQRLIKH